MEKHSSSTFRCILFLLALLLLSCGAGEWQDTAVFFGERAKVEPFADTGAPFMCEPTDGDINALQDSVEVSVWNGEIWTGYNPVFVSGEVVGCDSWSSEPWAVAFFAPSKFCTVATDPPVDITEGGSLCYSLSWPGDDAEVVMMWWTTAGMVELTVGVGNE